MHTDDVVTQWLMLWLRAAGTEPRIDGPPAEWASAAAERVRDRFAEVQSDYWGPVTPELALALMSAAARATASSLPPNLREQARFTNRFVLDSLQLAAGAWTLYGIEVIHTGGSEARWRSQMESTRVAAAALADGQSAAHRPGAGGHLLRAVGGPRA